MNASKDIVEPWLLVAGGLVAMVGLSMFVAAWAYETVVDDPATTAFTLLSLMRAGYTPVEGEYLKQVRRGIKYLVSSIEKAPTEGPLITDIQGTQPQSKLGRYVDTSMTAQYLARVLPLLPKESKLRKRVDKEKNRELAEAVVQNRVQIDRLGDEKLLKGFGNNGGEEFLSYLMTSESLVIAGGEKFQQWNGKMLQRLAKLQNTDGSWNGHHCITSPVFCTAAVVQCLTTDRDADFLIGMAKRSTGEELASADK